MLKKAGIVVAATAAGLLAISPLAFAGDKDGDKHHHRHGADKNINKIDDGDRTRQEGYINISADNTAIAVSDCDNQITQLAGLRQFSELTGVLGLIKLPKLENTNISYIECNSNARADDVNRQTIED